MITTAKITSKGQVTIPKEIRDMLKTDVVEFRLVKGNVIIKPVMSVGGSLQKYAKKYYPLNDTRNSVWEDVVNDKAKKNTN
jgi:AbrB family looped-hinge helix DNA binding protein